MSMTKDTTQPAWAIGVAEDTRKLFQVQEQALDNGVKVCVPKQYRLRRFNLICEPRIAPYFFVFYTWSDNQEYNLVKRLRGVKAVVKSGRPIPEDDIRYFLELEIREQRGAYFKAGKLYRSDLVTNREYVILSHATLTGRSGRLVYSVRGIAKLLADNGMVMEVNENNIAEVENSKGRRKA